MATHEVDPFEQEARCLGYGQYLWRASQVAAERSAWSPFAVVSVPVVCGESPWDEMRDGTLLSFIYTVDRRSSPANPRIYAPHAVLRLRPDGELASFEDLGAREVLEIETAGRDRDPAATVGHRFADDLAEARLFERNALTLVYYSLLVEDDGPLWHPWSELTAETRRDIGTIFRVLAEPPLLPLHERHAPEFVARMRG